MRTRFFSNGSCALLLCAAGALGACGETPTTKVDASAASAAKDPAMGGKLDEAARSLDAKASSSAVTSAAANQPPPNGIFAKGVADVAHAAGAPPKLELVSEGEGPKVQIHGAPIEVSQTLPMQIAVKIGQDGMPPLDLKLHIGPPGSAPAAAKPAGEGKPEKAAKPAAPKGGAAPSATADASAGPAVAPPADPNADRAMVLTVLSVGFAGMEEKDVPKQLFELIGPLAGATIDFTMTKTGPTKFTRKLSSPPAASAALLLDIQLGAIEETLTGLYTPAPPKPVGNGAFWMVTDRRPSLGAEVIRYRLFRVVGMEGDDLALQIEQRQYAVNEQNDLLEALGLEGHVMAAYGVEAKGYSKVVPKLLWPAEGIMQQRVGTQVIPAGAEPNPSIAREFRVEVTVQVGAAPAAAPGQPKKGGAPPPAPAPR